MSKPTYILNTQLPESQDFNVIKNRGLEYIQQHTGLDWTNLNPADPGITIWDQVCYALTELGYCSDFPIEDILTDINGRLHTDNQFILPDQALTTAPITINDYRKYLIDGIDCVINADLIPDATYTNCELDVYHVYLLTECFHKNKNICKAAFYYLNKNRNINQLFLMPVILTPVKYLLSGTIEIADNTHLEDLLAAFQKTVQEYIFPSVKAKGYNQVTQSDVDIDEVFNGPLLQNGWIPTGILGQKKQRPTALDISYVLKKVPGCVEAEIESVAIDTTQGKELLDTDKDSNITYIDIASSIGSKRLKIVYKGKEVTVTTTITIQTPAPGKQLAYGPLSAIAYADLPVGTYRDIESYYSIQNTFPSLYMVGENVDYGQMSDFQKAKSNQLRGYLTLFDQVIANQLSQLAATGRLFSFKNTTIASPVAYSRYLAYRDDQVVANEFPIPFVSFSPTYFFQPLYSVPGIQALLKNEESFSFGRPSESINTADERSWKEYTTTSYNTYYRGIFEILDSDQANLQRRNKILDHLLARHGESPVVIDEIINWNITFGTPVRNFVVIKSIYLQNLSLLSYNRSKGCDYLSASTVSEYLLPVPANYSDIILGHLFKDGVLDTPEINYQEKITSSDLSSYSTIELKIHLLFSLRILYHDFISTFYQTKKIDTQIAYWLITERKGCIMIENTWYHTDSKLHPVTTNAPSDLREIIVYNTPQNKYYVCKGFNNSSPGKDIIIAHLSTLNLIQLDEVINTQLFIYKDHLFFLQACICQGTELRHHLHGDWNIALCNNAHVEIGSRNTVNFIFPDFISPFLSANFSSAIALLLQQSLPPETTYTLHLAPKALLQQIIPLFARKCNSFRYKK
jgi:hypothetical protein